jgi:hypothetical protein
MEGSAAAATGLRAVGTVPRVQEDSNNGILNSRTVSRMQVQLERGKTILLKKVFDTLLEADNAEQEYFFENTTVSMGA